MELITSFMMLPEIYDRAAEDGGNKNPIFSYGDKEAWLVVTSGSELIGVINILLENGVSAEFHPYLLLSHKRKIYTVIKLLLEWYNKKMPPEIVKLNAQMPTYKTGLYKVAMRLGFTDEGLNRMSYKKNGVIYDRFRLGITREEMKWVK